MREAGCFKQVELHVVEGVYRGIHTWSQIHSEANCQIHAG